MNKTKEKNPDYFVLVNEDNRLPNGFEDTVELISTESFSGVQFKVEKKTTMPF